MEIRERSEFMRHVERMHHDDEDDIDEKSSRNG